MEIQSTCILYFICYMMYLHGVIVSLDWEQHSWKCEVVAKAVLDSTDDPRQLSINDAENIKEPKDLVLGLVHCFPFPNVNSWSTTRHVGLMSSIHTCKLQHAWFNMKQEISMHCETDCLVQDLMCDENSSGNARNLALSDGGPIDLHVAHSNIPTGCSVRKTAQNVKGIGNCSNTRIEDCTGCISSGECQTETFDVSFLLSVANCVYNRSGQLVGMTILFGASDSDSSSVSSACDSECLWSDSDGEDFIVFDRSAPEDQYCLEFDLSRMSCNSNPTDPSAKVPIFPSSKCSKDSMIKSFNKGLDTLVTEIQQPSLYLNCSASNKEFGNVKLLNNNLVSCADISDYNNTPYKVDSSSCTNGIKKTPKKRVQFKSDNKLTTTLHMVVWRFAYKHARKGPWETHAVDRLRFEKRIKELDKIITPVLLAKIDHSCSRFVRSEAAYLCNQLCP